MPEGIGYPEETYPTGPNVPGVDTGEGGQSGWMAILNMLMPLLPAGLGGIIGKYIDDTNRGNAFTGREAVGAAQGRYGDMQNLLGDVTRGETQSPQLQNARTAARNVTGRPLTPPTQFNPYKTDPSFGQGSPALMNQMLMMALGSNPNITQGRNLLQGSLNTRLGGQRTATGTGRK